MATKFNAAFWRWFGDSRVVDARGQPLVVYHGTRLPRGDIRQLAEFRTPTWFTEVENEARAYATDARLRGAKGQPVVLSAYLKIVNPYLAATQDACWYGPASSVAEYADGRWMERLKERGFDGMQCVAPPGNSRNRWAIAAGRFRYWTVFSPSQIKGVDNDGTWDADDPDIRSNPLGKIHFGDLPKDMRWYVADITGIDPKPSAELTVRSAPVSSFPVTAVEREHQDFGAEWLGVGSEDMPPVMVVGAKWIDGTHRIAALRQSGEKAVKYIDLREVGVRESDIESQYVIARATLGHNQPSVLVRQAERIIRKLEKRR